MKILKLTFKLSIIALITTLLLSAIYTATKKDIEKGKRNAIEKAMASILPGYNIDLNKAYKIGQGMYFWLGKKNGRLGYAVKVSARGYSSNIVMLIGISDEKKILGLSVLSQAETPGLGARVTEVASKNYIWQKQDNMLPITPWFTEQFKGISMDKAISLKHGKEFHQLSTDEIERYKKNNSVSAISGATITSKAVISGIKKVANILDKIILSAEEIETDNKSE